MGAILRVCLPQWAWRSCKSFLQGGINASLKMVSVPKKGSVVHCFVLFYPPLLQMDNAQEGVE